MENFSPPLISTHTYSLSAALLLLVSTSFFLFCDRAEAQTRLGAELSAGRSDLLFPLIANRSYLDRNGFAIVGDEVRGGGLAATLRVILLTSLELEISYQSYSRTAIQVNYRSEGLLDRRRQRTDGTVDDAGVIFQPVLKKEEVELDENYTGNMMSISVLGGYRFYLYDYMGFFIYCNVGAGLSLNKISGTQYDWAMGARAYAGVGTLYKFLSTFGVFFNVGFQGMVMQNYFYPEDASRITYQTNGFTEQAMFDGSMISNIEAGIHYTFQ